MREGKVKLFGKEYPACLSTRLMVKISEKTGKPFAQGINDLLSTDNIEGMFWLLAGMLEAGKKYHDLIGESTPEPPSEDTLMDMIGMDDYSVLAEAIYDAAMTTAAADVDVETDEKN